MTKQHAVFDMEVIGLKKPIVLVCVKIVETGERFAFWHDKRGHTKKLAAMLTSGDYTWVGFNSENFDRPLLAMAVMGHDETNIKVVAQSIINDRMMSWATYREFGIDFLEYDHIDVQEVPPGVMLSLKIYEGRMHAPNLQDMPFHHDHEIKTPKERKIVEGYCFNDIEETERLFLTVKGDIELREALGQKYGVDLRSKSDAQCAEAILKAVCNIGRKDKVVPRYVTYKAPSFIKTDSALINEIIDMCEAHRFTMNPGNGAVEFPDFLVEPITMGAGLYQMGVGGLHSKHDLQLHLKADEKTSLSDFDVAGYYPRTMIMAGLIPNLGGGKGELFLKTYENIYDQRIEAKRSGDKATANSLKITLNGTFGKLGSLFCSFYAPELMLAVTLTGQLNLLCLIHELLKIKGVTIESANTDGILVRYPDAKREQVLKKIQQNAKRTGYEYEETPYRLVAMKDVNNYYAVTADARAAIINGTSIMSTVAQGGKVKRKGLYGIAGVHTNKNPTMEVCSDAVAAYLSEGIEIEDWIRAEKDIRKFIEIRGVAKPGGVQHLYEVEVDDWVCINDLNSAKSEWMRQKWLDEGKDRKPVLRKSRPKPVMEGRGGTPFGRVARWYMTTDVLPAITYVESGNQVAGTAGSKLCMQLPDKLPKDLNIQWYIDEAHRILEHVGVTKS